MWDIRITIDGEIFTWQDVKVLDIVGDSMYLCTSDNQPLFFKMADIESGSWFKTKRGENI